MAAPVTVTAILAIAASRFVETATNKAGELVAPAVLQRAGAQVDKLWGRIKAHCDLPYSHSPNASWLGHL